MDLEAKSRRLSGRLSNLFHLVEDRASVHANVDDVSEMLDDGFECNDRDVTAQLFEWLIDARLVLIMPLKDWPIENKGEFWEYLVLRNAETARPDNEWPLTGPKKVPFWLAVAECACSVLEAGLAKGVDLEKE